MFKEEQHDRQSVGGLGEEERRRGRVGERIKQRVRGRAKEEEEGEG